MQSHLVRTQATKQVNHWPSKGRPKLPPIVIPPTPVTNGLDNKESNKTDPVVRFSLPHSRSSSPVFSTSHQSEMTTTVNAKPTDHTEVNDIFATLKRTVSTLHSTFNSLGTHAISMAQLVPSMKAEQQVDELQRKLREQLDRHEDSMREMQNHLEDILEEKLHELLKRQVCDMMQDTIAEEVEKRVKRELEIQIPEALRRQAEGHQKEIVEIQTNLHNSEARRHNGGLYLPSMVTEPLRPLLRPLPSALQSPAYVLKRPFTVNNSTVATPTTYERLPSSSQLFPRDLKSLFALEPVRAKRLLEDYGIESSADTDAVQDQAIPETGLETPATSPIEESREEDISKFMTHIGVPILMVPAPRPRDVNSEKERLVISGN